MKISTKGLYAVCFMVFLAGVRLLPPAAAGVSGYGGTVHLLRQLL